MAHAENNYTTPDRRRPYSSKHNHNASRIDMILSRLEEGTTMTRFYSSSKRKPENRIFRLKLDQLQLSWWRSGKEENAVNIQDIKEIRQSSSSKDFEKNTDYLKTIESENCCMVIFHGTRFNLKTISCVAQNAEECNSWVEALHYLMNKDVFHLRVVHRWLKMEWDNLTIANQNGVTMKELKQFLIKSNVKITNVEVQTVFQKIDLNNNDQIDFNDFIRFYETFMNHQMVSQYFYTLSKDRKNINAKKFRSFLMMDQKENFAQNEDSVKSHITSYLEEIRKPEPYFTFAEFLDYMFSKTNSVFNEEHGKIYQDMTQPLSQYWIASSHNTYLTGNQLVSESSVEAYVRCLRMGCRCVELDCWDGPDNQPVIYHGNTITSKIKFIDVIKAIHKNAFVASEYPLTLSIENHCSLPQQRVMAQGFRSVFGDTLLTNPVTLNEECLPSPEQLKHKIVIKYKKLPTDPNDVITATDKGKDDELSEATMDGILYLEDEIDKVWRPHFFVLNNTKLVWSEEQIDTEEKEDEEAEEFANSELSNEELHFTEPWFHRGIDGQAAKKLLETYNKGNGSFLVRESAAVSGGYSISFWRNGASQHCRIKTKQVNDETRYCLGENDSFVNLYSLIHYFQSHPLRTPQFEITLTEPIPHVQANAHADKDWFHTSLTRDEAEDMLVKAPSDGSFLVRQKDNSEKNESFALSFKAESKVKHCRIIKEGRLFTIGTAQFESLVDLVDYYRKSPLYRKIKLKYAINQQVIERIGIQDGYTECGDIYQELYLDPTYCVKPMCRALWDYKADNDQEMSFCKGAFITNVVKDDGGWWRGDFAEFKQAWFPSNYCREIDTTSGQTNDGEENNLPLGDLQQGSMNISDCKIEQLPPRGGLDMLIRITADGERHLEVAAKSVQDMTNWVECLKSTSYENRRLSKKGHPSKLQTTENKIDKMLSDLVVYCQAVPFDFEGIGKGKHYEMSSISESKVEKYTSPKNSARFCYNQNQLTRVYPKGSRVESTNYDPSLIWNCGVQMCALNYQTPDRAMQLNEGRFLDNGGCGYVLKPECTRLENFDPYKAGLLRDVTPCTVNLTIIGARHLPKISRGITSPFVEVEVIGTSYDSVKFKTGTQADNGLNPVYNDVIEFDVTCPPLAYVRFAVFDEDMFGDPNFVAQAVFPFTSLKQGYRSVPLKNAYGEEYEMSSLLVYLDMFTDEDKDIYASIHDLRNVMDEISTRIGEEATQRIMPNDENLPSFSKMKILDAEFREKQNQLQTLIEQRKTKLRGQKTKMSM